MHDSRGPQSSRDRGLASGIIGFIAIIVIAALLFTLFTPAINQIEATSSSQATSTPAQDVIDERTKIWNLMPIFALFLAVVALIARAVFESRGPG